MAGQGPPLPTELRASAMARSYLVLRLEPSGESFLKLHLLEPEAGLLLCLKRVARKSRAGGSPNPDLFDTAELTLEASKQGNLHFVADYHPTVRRSAIGGHYRRLVRASAFCQLLVLNATHLPDLPALYELANRALDAFCQRDTPDVVYLKSVYLLLKAEGYPVRESWWAQLPATLRSAAKGLIEAPSPETLSQAEQADCEAAIERLHSWIRRETEVNLPPGA